MDELEFQDVLRGKLMATLLAKGVRRQDIDTSILTDTDNPRKDFNHVMIDMMVWLEQEGFIRYRNFHQGPTGHPVFNHVVPTSLAMRLLDQNVEGQTTGRDVVKAKGSGDASSWGKFGAMIGGFVGGLTQSL